MFVFVVVLAILTGITFVIVHYVPAEYKKGWQIGAYCATGLTVLLLFISCIAIVSTKNVGIETAFGSVDRHLSNGFHLIPPWDSVTEMDAAIQTDSYTQKACRDVRIANQQTACVDVSIRWRIQPGAADSLFQNYRTFDNVRDSLVTRELIAALNNQLKDYNPLNTITVAETPGANYPTTPSLSQVAADVTGQMRREIGGQIDVLNTIIPFMTFDAQTQSRLNQLQQQEAQTRIAIAAQQTNEAQAQANQDLANSVNTSPNVLVSQCLSILSDMVKNHDPVPAGFSCWPGSGLAGVIANSTTPTTTPSK